MSNDKNKLLSPYDLADLLHVSRSTVYRLIETRKIPFYKVGGSIRFDEQDVLNYLEENKVEPIK